MIVMQEEDLLTSSSSLSSVVSRALVRGGGLGGGKEMGRGLQFKTHMHANVHWWYTPTTRVQRDLSRMLPFVDYIDPKIAISINLALAKCFINLVLHQLSLGIEENLLSPLPPAHTHPITSGLGRW